MSKYEFGLFVVQPFASCKVTRFRQTFVVFSTVLTAIRTFPIQYLPIHGFSNTITIILILGCDLFPKFAVMFLNALKIAIDPLTCIPKIGFFIHFSFIKITTTPPY